MLVAQKKVYIVLDALDESRTRNDVLQWIEDMVSNSELVHVQLLYTSRPETEFLHYIPPLIGEESCLPLDKRAVNSDIRSWVAARLSQRRDFTEKPLSEDFLEKIQRTVGDGADGMFRWAVCQLDSLARCRHEAAMEETLVSLPLDLNETYRRMIASIQTELKKDAIRLLQFLVHSEKPLKLAEATEIIATQIENESQGFNIKRRLFRDIDIMDYCPSLLTIVDGTDKELHLAHFSVKEYLLGEKEFEIANSSISITRTCLVYLTDITGDYVESRRDFPMAESAAELLEGNVLLAQTSEEIVQATVDFLEKEATFQRWTGLYQTDISGAKTLGLRLYYASFYGLLVPAQCSIVKGADVNATGGDYGNALQAASFRGHRETVKLLLENGADINAQGGHFRTALVAASTEGHRETVKLLLDNGADINAQGGCFGSALQTASANGHQEIVEMLRIMGTIPLSSKRSNISKKKIV